jgi:DNA-binding GntR family transcriptional regulator
MTTQSATIAQRILEAVLARKLPPGMRLGEQPLAMLFECSRTLVREALLQLATRGIVTVSARRGWYVVEPTPEQAKEAFDARLVIERGLIRQSTPPSAQTLKRLHEHLSQQRAAIAGDDVGARSYLLGDFHVCLAQCLGNRLLSDVLRDLTARTTLVAMRYQSPDDAAESCEDHVHIVAALERGDTARAEDLMAQHITTIGKTLRQPSTHDPLAQLRHALQPVPVTPQPVAGRRSQRRSKQTAQVAAEQPPAARSPRSSFSSS